jgi:Crinkler effector protein N-terminal domain
MNLGVDDLQLHCVIEGETEPFPIDIQGPLWRNPKFLVGSLKKIIQEERNVLLRGVDAHSLVLWKVRAIEESPRQTMWLTRHRSSPKTGILSMRNRNRLCPDVSRLLGHPGKN